MNTPTGSISTRGVLLGFDYGTVRVGIAISDPDRIIASPLETYARRSPELDAEHFAAIANANRAAAVVVGLPLHADGRESAMSAEARTFGGWLGNRLSLTVVFWDERFTSSLADDALASAGLSRGKRQSRRDRVAAQMILQNYLDAGCPISGPD